MFEENNNYEDFIIELEPHKDFNDKDFYEYVEKCLNVINPSYIKPHSELSFIEGLNFIDSLIKYHKEEWLYELRYNYMRFTDLNVDETFLINFLTEIIELFPQRILFYWERAILFEKSKNYKKSLEDKIKCLSIQPKSESDYMEKADFYVCENQDYKSAVILLENALIKYPNSTCLSARLSDNKIFLKVQDLIKEQKFYEIINLFNSESNNSKQEFIAKSVIYALKMGFIENGILKQNLLITKQLFKIIYDSFEKGLLLDSIVIDLSKAIYMYRLKELVELRNMLEKLII